MASFGENLRRERELRGITLPELADATKIGVRYLRALESDRFEQLPGGVFNRGFVRAVARYMKLDDRHWVDEFACAANEEPELVAHYAPPAPRSIESSHRGLLSFFLLVAVFGVGAYVVHAIRAQRAAEAAQSARSSLVSAPPAEAPVADAQPAAETAPAKSTDRPSLIPAAAAADVSARQPEDLPPASPRLSPTNSSESDAAPSPAALAQLFLQVDVLDEAWLSVKVDGREAYSGIMRPHETSRFEAASRIELVTGNASAVILTLNGETLAPLGNPGERKEITLTTRDLRPASP